MSRKIAACPWLNDRVFSWIQWGVFFLLLSRSRSFHWGLEQPAEAVWVNLLCTVTDLWMLHLGGFKCAEWDKEHSHNGFPFTFPLLLSYYSDGSVSGYWQESPMSPRCHCDINIWSCTLNWVWPKITILLHFTVLHHVEKIMRERPHVWVYQRRRIRKGGNVEDVWWVLRIYRTIYSVLTGVVIVYISHR